MGGSTVYDNFTWIYIPVFPPKANCFIPQHDCSTRIKKSSTYVVLMKMV